MQHGFTLTKLYFVIVALVGIIGLTVGYGIALYQFASVKLITDEEYMAGNYRDFQNCEQENYLPDGKSSTKTPAEIEKCTQDAKTNLLGRRSKESKESILGGLVRGTLFLILFLIHFPTVLKYRNQE